MIFSFMALLVDEDTKCFSYGTISGSSIRVTMQHQALTLETIILPLRGYVLRW
jgi:hypothetical protein